MNHHPNFAFDRTAIVLDSVMFAAGGGTDLRIWEPATFTVATAGTGYSDGSATCVLADGNTLTVLLTTDEGAITGATWCGGYSTSGSDTGSMTVVQEGGASGEIAVATYSTLTPAMIDFGPLAGNGYQYTLSFKTVTEHDTAPGGSKTIKVNRYISDEALGVTNVHTLLAARKTAGSALAITNAVDITQYFEVASAFTPGARYMHFTFDVTALTAGSSFTETLRLNLV